jgi:hypothetical protein
MLREVFAEDRNWVEITKGIIRARTMPIDRETAKDLLG